MAGQNENLTWYRHNWTYRGDAIGSKLSPIDEPRNLCLTETLEAAHKRPDGRRSLSKHLAERCVDRVSNVVNVITLRNERGG